MPIFGSRWQRTQDMSEVGTTEEKLAVWKFPAPAKWDGHDIIGADRRFSYNDGIRMRVSGASTLTGSGTVTMKLYKGTGDTATELIATYGPFTAAQLVTKAEEKDYWKFPPTSEGGTTFQLGLTASGEAGTAFSAGSLDVILEFD